MSTTLGDMSFIIHAVVWGIWSSPFIYKCHAIYIGCQLEIANTQCAKKSVYYPQCKLISYQHLSIRGAHRRQESPKLPDSIQTKPLIKAPFGCSGMGPNTPGTVPL